MYLLHPAGKENLHCLWLALMSMEWKYMRQLKNRVLMWKSIVIPFQTRYVAVQANNGCNMAPKNKLITICYQFRTLFDRCNIDYDVYIRTTDEKHKQAVWALWDELYKKGYLYEGTYEGWYCVPDEAFLTQLQVKEGPNGKLVSIESGHPVEWVSEKNWMFKYLSLKNI